MTEATSTRPPRILVVDDNPDVAGIVRLALRRVPRKVDVVAEVNADRALDLLKSERFDLILSDFRMREMDGLAFLARARAAHPDGRRVLFTAYAARLDPAALAEAGLDGCIEKPMQLSALAAILDAVLAGDAPTLAALHRAIEARTGASA